MLQASCTLKKSVEKHTLGTYVFKLLVLIIVLNASQVVLAQGLKVACIGDSVTFGLGIQEINRNSYPAQLDSLLGKDYQVVNFGISGATLLKKGHRPYWDQKAFIESKSYLPDIVVIHLGLNDQGLNNWPDHNEDFVADYVQMISEYAGLSSNPRILICKMTPTFSGHHWFEDGMRENFKEIQLKIEQVAMETKVQLVDLHEPLYLRPELFPDDLHPTTKGASIIAQRVYSAITGDYGGLRLPVTYSENMVLQRDEPIKFVGTSNAQDNIKVNWQGRQKNVIVGANGKWEVEFPKREAGGPFTLSIETEKSKKRIDFKNVFVGDVWLASGQSNMDFMIREEKSASSIMKDSVNSNVFLFSMDGKVLHSNPFSTAELKHCNASSYFQTSGWMTAQNENFQMFSAIAYSFAHTLQSELDVPIGIICNAIGGAPIESWISRESLESEHWGVDLLNDTWNHPYTHPWVAKRKTENFNGQPLLKEAVRHPYDPTFLYDSGIHPLLQHNINGVVWYQGESNTNNVELYNKMFRLLVEDWREHWKKDELPFYFAQLSNIYRPNWGFFRDGQRRLTDMPFVDMAVTMDLGHPTDVHPIEKWPIGVRLANLALVNLYDRDYVPVTPRLDYVNVSNDTLEIFFNYPNDLIALDGAPIRDMEVANENGIFRYAKTKLGKTSIKVWSPQVSDPRYVRYGYDPYSGGNLGSAKGLPVSTFSNASLNWMSDKFFDAPVDSFSKHYLTRRGQFETSPDTTNEVIFLGDSITEGGDWNILFPGINVINRGISGDTTRGVLNRINEIIVSNPNSIFLLIGTNDLARGAGIDQVVHGIMEIVAQLKAGTDSTRIYVQSLLPINPFIGDSFKGHKGNHYSIMEVNRRLNLLLNEVEVDFIDLHKAFKDDQDFLDARFTDDGLHLNTAGYQHWKQVVDSFMN